MACKINLKSQNMEKKVSSGMLFSEFFTFSEKEQTPGQQRAFLKTNKVARANLKQPVERSLKMYESGQSEIRRKFKSSDKPFFRTAKWNMVSGDKSVLKETKQEVRKVEPIGTTNRRIKSNDKDIRKICRVV